MDRDPALHVKQSDLVAVLKSMGVARPERFADTLMKKAVGRSVRNRYVVDVKAKRRKTAERVIKAGNLDVDAFSGVLGQERMRADHRGVKPIRSGTSEYTTLKDVCQLAHDFAEAYKFDNTIDGYRTYCRIAIELMGKRYALRKMKSYDTRICELYEMNYAIQKDNDPEGTAAIHEIYQEIMQREANVEIDLSNEGRYAFMVYARQEADDVDAFYDDWVEAQFDALAFLNDVPNPNQLFGENAVERWKRYEGKKGKKRKAEGKSNFRDKDEEDYFRKARQGSAG
jgi:hypothetical protein